MRSDFLSLDKIAQSGQCFRWEEAGPHAYRIPAFGRVLLVRQTSAREMTLDCSADEWGDLWADYFDWQTDYAGLCAMADPTDAYLRAAIRSARGVRILRQEPWEMLVSFIISQNNNIPRIRLTLQRLCASFGGFPSPEALADCDERALRDIGLGYRAPYLPKAARRYLTEDGTLDGGYQECRDRLLRYEGVGPKVAACVCLFGLGHKEAFPVDTWVRRIVNEHYAGRFPTERYPGAAGVMQQFMFYHERTLSKGEAVAL